MTSIAIIGGTGYAGSNIAAEAARRGLAVTAVSRSEAEVPAGVTHVRGSLADQGLVERLAAEHDVLVIATPPTGDASLVDLVPAVAKAAVAGGARLGFVGGAGSLLVAEGGPRLVDTPDFPAEYRPEALAHGEVLEALRADASGLDWFYVSPAAQFGAWAPGETTGSYRTADDVLLVDADGGSEVSGTDFALGFVDEIVTPAHRNARFTVAH